MRYQLTADSRAYLYCSLLSLGGFLFGYNFNVMTVVVAMPDFMEKIGESKHFRSFSGTMSLGAFVGSMAGGVLADRVGRRRLMVLASVIFLFGSFFQTAGYNMAIILVGRAITGFSVGIYTMLVPLYQSELAPKHLRGRLIAIHQFAITLGIFTATWISFGTTKIPNETSWRLPIGLQMIPCLLLGVLVSFLPESPRYLMYMHQDSAALTVLAKMHGDGSTSHAEVYMEYVSIKQTIAYEKKFTDYGSYRRLLSKAPENNGRRLFLGILTQIFQQLTGINPILMFAPHVFQSAGLTGVYSSLFANALSVSVNMLATIPAILFIDRFSRRHTMLAGAGLLCVCLVTMSVLSLLSQFIGNRDLFDDTPGLYSGDSNAPLHFRHATEQTAIAFIVVEYLYIAVYASTWGSLGWIYPSELYGQGVRAKALSIAFGFGWLLNFAVFEFSQPMLSNIQGKSYIVFACCCAAIVIYVYLYFPETKGKSLEEIDLIFGSDIGYYDVNAHHPQTAAATLDHMENIQKKNANIYPFPLNSTARHRAPTHSGENETRIQCEDGDAKDGGGGDDHNHAGRSISPHALPFSSLPPSISSATDEGNTPSERALGKQPTSST